MTDTESTKVVSAHDITYLGLLHRVLHQGEDSSDRTGVGTRSIFGEQLRFDLAEGFPLLTTKSVWWRGLREELFWMLRGQTDLHDLPEDVRKLWSPWAKAGMLGPIYGEQWRHAQGFDQIQYIENMIRTEPHSRRIILSSWRPEAIHLMALPPCHVLMHFRVLGGRLHLQLYQRSCDYFLGGAFNLGAYSLLLSMMAKVTGYPAGVFTWTLGDVHLYHNHLAQARRQLTALAAPAPRVDLEPAASVIDYAEGRAAVELHNYTPAEPIPAPVAV
ncbi:thymidylate synthase [Halorhodospira halophila]|uniref:thymidylate synthase n=1 Tax=Halorhodospira halophila TaxID=1053 RepID=UPI0019129DAA|nr:thymidylate synthase [Halorhodospira halophila]MBK5943359.1 thymidylate synthase [Halorhodospira halophila]